MSRPQKDKVRDFLNENKDSIKISNIAKYANCTKENLYMYMGGSNLSPKRRRSVIKFITKYGFKP